jgi:hypothetical protein
MVFEMDYLWAACAIEGNLDLSRLGRVWQNPARRFPQRCGKQGWGKLMRQLLGGSNDVLPRAMQF